MANVKMQQKTAQLIAERVSEVLGYSVLVTNDEGMIIGCAEKNRVGTFHKPSIESMREKKNVLTSPEAANEAGIRPGYTAPITISGNIVGSISISGLPQKVERYGRLVQRQAEILLMEQAFLEVRLRRQLALRDLAEGILLYRQEEAGEELLLLHGRELGFDLEHCRIAVMIDIRRTSADSGIESYRETALNLVTNFFDNPMHLIAPLRGDQIAVFLALPCSSQIGEMGRAALKLCEDLFDYMEREGVDIEIGIGCEADSIPSLSRSAHTAREAISVGRALGMRICPSERLRSEMMLSYLPSNRKRQHIDAVFRMNDALDAELADTFMAWCRNPFSVAEVARELSIHRNTLQYRLKKIKEQLGLDPWNFQDCFAIWSAVILRKFEKG